MAFPLAILLGYLTNLQVKVRKILALKTSTPKAIYHFERTPKPLDRSNSQRKISKELKYSSTFKLKRMEFVLMQEIIYSLTRIYYQFVNVSQVFPGCGKTELILFPLGLQKVLGGSFKTFLCPTGH